MVALVGVIVEWMECIQSVYTTVDKRARRVECKRTCVMVLVSARVCAPVCCGEAYARKRDPSLGLTRFLSTEDLWKWSFKRPGFEKEKRNDVY
jgi:hypothetical protein